MLLDWTDYYLIVTVLAVLFAIAISAALGRQRSPQASTAWVLFIILVPYVGLPAFLAFGLRLGPGPRAPAAEDAPGLAKMLACYDAGPRRGGTDLRLHASNSEAREALFGLVEGAERTLDVALYQLANDATGLEFLALLERRAQAGVQVRLCLDGIGAVLRPRRAIHAAKRSGVKVHVHARIFPPKRLWSMDRRNHRKIAIADGAHLWSGGRNVGDVYLSEGEGAWTDLGFTARGPLVAEAARLFAEDWPGRQIVAAPVVEAGEAEVQLLPTGPSQPGDGLHEMLLHLIHTATDRIEIGTPYFTPTETLTTALAMAGRRGVDVRIVLPTHSNHPAADLARGAFIRQLEQAGCRFHWHGNGMFHAKAMRFDDRVALVGSANCDSRSLLTNKEMMVLLWSPAEIAAVRDWFETVMAGCGSEGPEDGPLRRLAERTLRLAAPLL
ncbi:phospholipase D-like domain-containing protein [Wenxinia saemankumensis]|uniref:Phospholipase D n=1 Tax=Wenxinia saemankumensis TaxID=1447782 RepID=A0A1M6CQC2_9RHOB|nr:phospholipase D-like domain-containing protein [Wenxinia saemankumensis]SHI63083.1 cardiolipin synthetase 2 [Wenxinia saemankumensis]